MFCDFLIKIQKKDCFPYPFGLFEYEYGIAEGVVRESGDWYRREFIHLTFPCSRHFRTKTFNISPV